MAGQKAKPPLDIRELAKLLLGTAADPWTVAQAEFDCDDWHSDEVTAELEHESVEQCGNCNEWNRDTDIGMFGDCIDCEEIYEEMQ